MRISTFTCLLFSACVSAPPSMPSTPFPPPPSSDQDDDGIPNTRDSCPQTPEDQDGYQDADGCPDPDNDGDGRLDSEDKCPNDPEDMDGFQDEDGCPDVDNDGDGFRDAEDTCPNRPETVNGVQDDDGCPDDAQHFLKHATDQVQIPDASTTSRGAEQR